MSAAVEPSNHGGDGGCRPPGGGGNWQPRSGCAASGSKQGRKKTKNIGLKKTWKKHQRQQLPIQFEKGNKGTYKAVGDNSSSFNSLSGTIVSRIPYYYPAWAKVLREHKCTIYGELKSYFDMKEHLRGPESKQLKIGLNKYLAGLYRGQKHKFSKKYFEARGGLDRAEQLREDPPEDMLPEEWRKFVDFKTSEAFQKRSRANKGCRAAQKIIVRHGRKNQAQIRFENQGVSPIELWKEKRQKDGQFTETEAVELYDEMKKKQDDPDCTLDDYEIMQEVLGERRGWTRGIGPKLPQSAFYDPGCSSSSQQPTFTLDQVRQMVADYTRPLWQKQGMEPPTLSQNDGDDDDGEDEDGEDDGSEFEDDSSSDDL